MKKAWVYLPSFSCGDRTPTLKNLPIYRHQVQKAARTPADNLLTPLWGEKGCPWIIRLSKRALRQYSPRSLKTSRQENQMELSRESNPRVGKFIEQHSKTRKRYIFKCLKSPFQPSWVTVPFPDKASQVFWRVKKQQKEVAALHRSQVGCQKKGIRRLGERQPTAAR